MSDLDDATPVTQLLGKLQRRITTQQAEVSEMFAELAGELTRLVTRFAHIPQASAAQQSVEAVVPEISPRTGTAPGAFDFLHASAEPSGVDLETVVFGPTIAANVSLAAERAQLIRDLTTGDAAAMTLCGAIMLFRGANTERMPQLLKDIGEAWYAWSPHTAEGDDDLRDALCHWLERTCAEAGTPNTLELVRPGDRYDAKRHHARQPGVEVTEVGGWVVLRDNGKVYTKANVGVR